MEMEKIPEATISRLSLYSRFLTQMEERGILSISSGEIADGIGGTSAQVRKDLAYFGEFGTRGVGYNVVALNHEICSILGLERDWKVVLVGAGNLGSALSNYKGFRERGFTIQAIFDNDLNKVGLRLHGIPILPSTGMKEYLNDNHIDIVLIAVPADCVQDVTDILSETNIKGVLNFAPTTLDLPENILVRNVDLAVNLEILSFNIAARE